MLGPNRTSRLVPVVREISNVRIPDFRFFSLPDSGLIRVLEMEKSLRFTFCHFEIHFYQLFFDGITTTKHGELPTDASCTSV